MKRWERVVVALAVAAALVSGCGKGSVAESHGDTTTTPPTGQSVTASEIDSLLLSDADLERMGIVYERQAPETTLPDWGGIDESDPCQQAEWVSGLQPWSAFRMVDSRGSSNFGIHQVVAIYSDELAARKIFKKYSDYASSCTAKGGQEVFTATTPSELAWSVPTANEVGAFTGNVAAWNIRVVKNVVVDVESMRRRDGVAATAKIADQIVAKINSSV